MAHSLVCLLFFTHCKKKKCLKFSLVNFFLHGNCSNSQRLTCSHSRLRLLFFTRCKKKVRLEFSLLKKFSMNMWLVNCSSFILKWGRGPGDTSVLLGMLIRSLSMFCYTLVDRFNIPLRFNFMSANEKL